MSSNLYAPLRGLRVFEESHTPAAAHAGRILRQLGADVFVATTGSRRCGECLLPPALATVLAHGKREYVARDDRNFDIAISDRGCCPNGSTPHDAEIVATVQLAIVGSDLRAADGIGTSFSASAISGAAIAMGRADAEPLGLPAGMAESIAGAQGVAALLAAWYGRDRSMVSSRIEVSVNGCLEYFVGLNQATAYTGYPRKWHREGRRASGSSGPYPAAIFPSRDGFVGVIGRTVNDWQGILKAMGDPAWADDPLLRDPYYIAEHRADEIDAFLSAWTAQHTTEELSALALQHGFTVGKLNTLTDVLESEQHRLRDFWELLPDGTKTPGIPFRVQRTSTEASAAGARERQGKTLLTDPTNLLSGIRVLDLSWVWAGPMTAAILADLGAEVIKVEHPNRPDVSRVRGRPTYDGTPVEGPLLEVTPYSHQMNHGKLSVGADITDPDTASIVRRLAASCDVVIENMRPGVLDRRGLGYPELSGANPGIVMLSMTMAGQHGPLSRMRGYAAVMSGLAGLEGLVRYGPDDVTGMYTFSISDPNASVYGVIAILAALIERDRGEPGCWIDLSQVEAVIANLTMQFADEQAGVPQPASSNIDPRVSFQAMVPAQAGYEEQRWFAVTALAQADLVALVEMLPPGTSLGSHSEIAERLASEFDRLGVEEMCERLRSRGVIVSPVLSWAGVCERRAASAPTSVSIWHPYGAPVPVPTMVPPWRFEDQVPASSRRAPLLGEHTVAVVDHLAGVGDDHIDELLTRGALVQFEGHEKGDASA